MFEKKQMLFLYVETPLHAGAGRSLGVVDLPIQREKVTGYPMVQASGLKGCLRSECLLVNGGAGTLDIPEIFGPEDSSYAASISFGDARILLFPVRSLNGTFAWVTCKEVLEGFRRSLTGCSQQVPDWNIPEITDPQMALRSGAGVNIPNQAQIVLEEYTFTSERNEVVSEIAEWLANYAIPDSNEYQYIKDSLKRKLVLLHENSFRDFTQTSTEVQTHIKINPDTNTVSNRALWVTENLPAETLMYAPVYASRSRAPGANKTADEILQSFAGYGITRVQLGGDNTTGQGIVAIRMGGV